MWASRPHLKAARRQNLPTSHLENPLHLDANFLEVAEFRDPFQAAGGVLALAHAVGQLLPLIERGELSLDMAGMDDTEDTDDSPTPEG